MNSKPRLKLHRSVWHCYLLGSGDFHTLCGLGMTPKDAYVDWAILNMKASNV